MTAIFVFCFSRVPFCATNSVGITNLALDLQRLPFAASAENLP